MSKNIALILGFLLIGVVFFLVPLLMPGDDYYSDDENGYEMSEEYESDDIDIDFKKKKYSGMVARSVGGSKSFRSGK